MYTKLSDAKLKTGEDLEIGLVMAPDLEYAEDISKVLHHKGEPWLSHVNRALNGDIKDLETRFYIGKLDGKVVANIMTVEYNRTGILGHVFTVPEQRRKHICSLIMSQQMEDFKRRGGGILLLGTGYDSPAYWIYHSFGFRSIIEKSGFMRFSTEDDFESIHFASNKVKVVDVQWKHWPLMNILTSIPSTEVFRSLILNLYGIGNFEGGFLHFIKRIEEGNLKAKILESNSGMVVGCAIIEQDRRWTKGTFILDIFMHPNFTSHYESFFNILELPKGKVQCYFDTKSPNEKVRALRQAGFRQEAILEKQYIWGNEWNDVIIYSKFIE